MAMSKATTVEEFLAGLPADRRAAIAAVRKVINDNLPPGYEEGILYGMLSWYVPFSRLAETYNGQPLCLAGLAAQKQYMSLYLMTVYGDPKLRAWFDKACRAAGKKLDMGKSCIRFETLDDLPLDVVGQAIAKVRVDDYVAAYQQTRAKTKTGARTPAARKATRQKRR